MNNIPEGQDFELISLVEKLRSAPERSPRMAANGRVKFLVEAQTYHPAVSRPHERRHIEWKTIFSRKAHPKMATFSTLLLIFTLLFGGTGATAYAAQNSLPDETLYPVKLMTEDIRSGITVQSDDRLELALQFAQRRLDEMLAMNQAGQPLSSVVETRWEQQIQSALQLTANMNETAISQAMRQVRERLMEQDHQLSQHLETHPADPILEQVHEQIRDHLQLVDQGVSDHDAFRSRVHNNDFGHHPEQEPEDTHQPGIVPGHTQTPFSHPAEPEHRSTEVPHQAATLQPTYHPEEEQHPATMQPQHTSQPEQHQNNPDPDSHPSEPEHNNDSGGDHSGGDDGGHQGGHD
jgi:hypothetical protein